MGDDNTKTRSHPTLRTGVTSNNNSENALKLDLSLKFIAPETRRAEYTALRTAGN